MEENYQIVLIKLGMSSRMSHSTHLLLILLQDHLSKFLVCSSSTHISAQLNFAFALINCYFSNSNIIKYHKILLKLQYVATMKTNAVVNSQLILKDKP